MIICAGSVPGGRRCGIWHARKSETSQEQRTGEETYGAIKAYGVTVLHTVLYVRVLRTRLI